MNLALGPFSFRLEVLVLIGVLIAIMYGHLIYSCVCFDKKGKEGFAPNNFAEGAQFAKSGSPGTIRNPDTWASPTLVYSPATGADSRVKSIMDRTAQPVPLPEGELDVFATTPFKPECCPNTYSNSMGCACMTVKQYDYLVDRGGNNVPYSDY